MTTAELDMYDIVKNASIGPFSVGRALSEIGNEIGVPDFWSFSPGPQLDFYATYGPLEVYIKMKGNLAVINFLKLKAFKFKRKAIIFNNPYNGKKLEVTISNSWRKYDIVRNKIHNLGINFSTEFQEEVKSDTSAVLNIGNSVKFYFGSDGADNVLETVEL